MYSNRFGLKTLTLMMVFGFLLSGCHQMSSTPASNTSFAQTPACVKNAFLQKYNCDTANIEQAAESGDPDAQYALGYLNYYGVGVPQDTQTALVWIRKAAAQDQPLAKQALLIMEKSSLSTESSVNNSSLYPSPGQNYSTNSTHDAVSSDLLPKGAADVTSSLNTQLPEYGKTAPTAPAAPSTVDNGSGMQTAPTPTPTPTTTSTPNIDMLQSSDASPPTGASAVPVKKDTMGVAKQGRKLTADERYLLSVNSSDYTIELMGSHNLQSILDFIQANQLTGQVNYYKTAMQNRTWYILIYGHYTSKAAAQLAMSNLSAAVRAQNSWVRSFAEIKQDIKQNK